MYYSAPVVRVQAKMGLSGRIWSYLELSGLSLLLLHSNESPSSPAASLAGRFGDIGKFLGLYVPFLG